jgi:glutathione peroxidase
MKKLGFLLCISLGACFNKVEIKHRPTLFVDNKGTQSNAMLNAFYALSAKTLDGEVVSFETFKGKKLILLNVASECGYTPQYADWQKFYEQNKEKVVVLGFPCNQFLGQEPGNHETIKAFCQKNYGVTFPIFEKSDVKGNQKSPIYAWLTDAQKNGWNTQEPTWNFCKYLVNERGELVEFFASAIKPDNAEFLKAWNKP